MSSPPGQRPGRGGASRLIGFATIPLISALSPLIVIPALTGSFGARTWASVALAQSIGSAAAVVIELGWGLNGPQRVAKAGQGARARLYALALVTKLVVAVPLALPVVGIALWLAPEEPGAAALVALAMSLSTLSPAWFFIGTGKPRHILLLDALPRLAANVAAAAAIHYGNAPLISYPVLLLVGTLVPPLLGWWLVGARVATVRDYGTRRIVRVIGVQSVALQGRLASAAYITLPVIIVGAVAPSALVLFSAAERLQRLTLALLAAVPNALQAWIGKPGTVSERRRRVNQAVAGNVALGVLAGATFTVLGRVGSEILFAGQITLPLHITALCGGVIAVTCVSRATGGLGLVASRKLSALRNSAFTGACVGPLLVWILSVKLGAPGGLLAELVTELIVLGVQIVALYGRGTAARS